MKVTALLAVALATATFATAPALAQRSAATFGNYSDVTGVKILPGQFENYMDYLKAQWVKQQEWAKSKGYIVGYKILVNTYPRENEPTLYLITEYKTVPTPTEAQRQADEFTAMMKLDEHQMDAAAEKRGPMRTIGSQSMLQEVTLK